MNESPSTKKLTKAKEFTWVKLSTGVSFSTSIAWATLDDKEKALTHRKLH